MRKSTNVEEDEDAIGVTIHTCPFCLRPLPWDFLPIPIVLPCCGKYACSSCGSPLLLKPGWTCLGCFTKQTDSFSYAQYTTRLQKRADPNQTNCFRSQITLGLLASTSLEAINYWLQAEHGALKAKQPLPPIIQYKMVDLICSFDPNTAAIEHGNAWENGTLQGRKGKKDSILEAARWYIRSAGQGYDVAMFKCGMMHESGKGMKRSHAAASGFYGKAAIKGNVDAMRRLGIIQGHGMGQADPNPETACRWWKEASEKGDAASMVLLGRGYSDGIGVSKSDKEAVILWNRAANLGNGEAMFLVGEAHRHGRGVPKRNVQQAIHWFKKSAGTNYFAAPGMLRIMGACTITGGIIKYVSRPKACSYCDLNELEFEDVMIMCRRCCSVGYCSDLCKHSHFRERHQKECGTLTPLDEVEVVPSVEEAWDQYQTANGDWYWYNEITAESSWTKP